MKNTLRQVFHSSKFVTGFVIFVLILLLMFIYPLINPGDPLEMIGVGTFAKPGTYVSMYDATKVSYDVFRLPDAADKRLAAALSDEDRVAMVEWFGIMEIDISGLDITDTDALLELWSEHYDESIKPKGMTQARRNYFKRLNRRLEDLKGGDIVYIADEDGEGGLKETGKITTNDYVRVGAVPNVKVLPLGTDNFGRDVLKELVAATGTSIQIGLIAGTVATIIGSSDPHLLFSGSGPARRSGGCDGHRLYKLDLDLPLRPKPGYQPA